MEQTNETFDNMLLGPQARQRVLIQVAGVSKEKWPEAEFHLMSGTMTGKAAAARKSHLEKMGLSSDQGMVILEETVQLIFYTLHKVESDERFFETQEQVRDLPYDTIFALADDYSKFAEKYNPSFSELSKDELESFKKKLMNGESVSGLSYLHLLSLVQHLADSLATLTQPVGQSSEPDQKTSQEDSGSSIPPSTNESNQTTENKSKPAVEISQKDTKETAS